MSSSQLITIGISVSNSFVDDWSGDGSEGGTGSSVGSQIIQIQIVTVSEDDNFLHSRILDNLLFTSTLWYRNKHVSGSGWDYLLYSTFSFRIFYRFQLQCIFMYCTLFQYFTLYIASRRPQNPVEEFSFLLAL
jgi:hypothetical protein